MRDPEQWRFQNKRDCDTAFPHSRPICTGESADSSVAGEPGVVMRLAKVMVLLAGLAAGLFVSVPAPVVLAQTSVEIPPLPRPRPDREAMSSEATERPAAATAADAISALTDTPQPVRLSALITEEGQPIADGLLWTVFNAQPDDSGEMVMVAEANTGVANFELPPGDYLVHVGYGHAQAGEALSVGLGENDKVVVLHAGALRLNSAVTGDIPISPAQVTFDIYAKGAESSETLIAQNVPPNQIVTLTADVYKIVSHYGKVNAEVRADLRVEPGQLTDATLYHHASEVSFKLVSEEGGEAIADVEWTVQTADGKTVFTDRGAFPSAVFAEGEYLVFAKVGDNVYNREILVQPGTSREFEVLSTIY